MHISLPRGIVSGDDLRFVSCMCRSAMADPPHQLPYPWIHPGAPFSRLLVASSVAGSIPRQVVPPCYFPGSAYGSLAYPPPPYPFGGGMPSPSWWPGPTAVPQADSSLSNQPATPNPLAGNSSSTTDCSSSLLTSVVNARAAGRQSQGIDSAFVAELRHRFPSVSAIGQPSQQRQGSTAVQVQKRKLWKVRDIICLDKPTVRVLPSVARLDRLTCCGLGRLADLEPIPLNWSGQRFHKYLMEHFPALRESLSIPADKDDEDFETTEVPGIVSGRPCYTLCKADRKQLVPLVEHADSRGLTTPRALKGAVKESKLYVRPIVPICVEELESKLEVSSCEP